MSEAESSINPLRIIKVGRDDPEWADDLRHTRCNIVVRLSRALTRTELRRLRETLEDQLGDSAKVNVYKMVISLHGLAVDSIQKTVLTCEQAVNRVSVEAQEIDARNDAQETAVMDAIVKINEYLAEK